MATATIDVASPASIDRALKAARVLMAAAYAPQVIPDTDLTLCWEMRLYRAYLLLSAEQEGSGLYRSILQAVTKLEVAATDADKKAKRARDRYHQLCQEANLDPEPLNTHCECDGHQFFAAETELRKASAALLVPAPGSTLPAFAELSISQDMEKLNPMLNRLVQAQKRFAELGKRLGVESDMRWL